MDIIQLLEDQIKRRGRPKGSVKYSQDDANYVKTELKYNGKTPMSVKIKATKDRYLNLLKTNNADIGDEDESSLRQMSLKQLRSLLDANKIDAQSYKRKRDWKKHEDDVIDGINSIFASKIFKLDSSGKEADINPEKFEAIPAGGGKQSDVKVQRTDDKKRFFFVECKLNFAAAEYFKYGLKVDGNKITYDHHVYTDGMDEVVSKEEIDKVDKLFLRDINISGFLNELVNSSQLKASWNKFLKNALEVEKFIEKSNEFKQFSDKKFQQKFPADFEEFASVFDTYCRFYIDKYNSLVDKLFLVFDSEGLKKDWFKIRSHKNNSKDNVFQTMTILQMTVEEDKREIFDKQAYEDLIAAILKIELKLNLLLEALGKNDSQISDLLKLEDKHKTKYFFKLFISSVGRKKSGNDFNDLSEEDEMGNMMICSQIVLNTSKLAQMITDFYVKKDKCAYIQIADTIYQLYEKWNPFNIEKLPIFKDVLNKFAVRMTISDDLSSIRLHINAIEPDKKLLSGYNLLSFKQQDANYICEKVEKIVVNSMLS